MSADAHSHTLDFTSIGEVEWRNRLALARLSKGLIWLILFAFAITPLMGFPTALTIVVVAAASLAVFGYRYPSIGLLGIGLLCVLDAPARVFVFTEGSLLPWSTIDYIIVGAIGWSWYFQIQLRDLQTRAMQALLILMFATLVVTPSLANGLFVISDVAAYFALLFYLIFATKESKFWLGIVGGIAGAVGGLAFYFSRFTISFDAINQNAWAYFPLTAMITTFLALSAARTGRQQFTLLGLCVLNYAWVFMSFSRSGMLAGGLILSFMLLRLHRLSRKVVAAAIALLTVTTILSAFPAYRAQIIQRVEHTFDMSASLTDRSNVRSDIMIAGWNVFLDHPFGVGSGGFQETLKTKGYEYNFFEERQAHAGWIKMLAENGVAGGLLLLLFVISFAWIGFRRRDEHGWLYGLCVSVTLGAVFMVSEFQPLGLWLLAASGVEYYRRDELNALAYLARIRSRLL